MKPRKRDEIERALCKKGFVLNHSHHDMLFFYKGEKKTKIYTRLSHGISEYSKSLMSKMKRQLKLSSDELDMLIDCPLTKEMLLEIYIERGMV